jgi:hypothetical protein
MSGVCNRQHPSPSEVAMQRDKDNEDNRANQLNPNNDAYWQSRGEDERPQDWSDHVDDGDKD